MLELLFGPSKRRASESLSEVIASGYSGSGRRRGGISVNEDSALNFGAVWCCTRILAETMASFPAFVYRRLPDNNREAATDHPVYSIIHDEPNERMGIVPYVEGRMVHTVNGGNGFAELERNGRGEVVAQWPIARKRVRPGKANEPKPYYVRNETGGGEVGMDAQDMLHLPGCLPEDGVWGKGIIQHARETIAAGLATQQHGQAYFSSGAQPKGVLMLPGMKTKEVRQNFREEYKEIHASPDSNEVLILPPEGKYQALGLSNEDSQFLETMKYQRALFATWYRTPLHMMGDLDNSHYNNIEHVGIEFLVYGMFPWVRRWEGEYNRKFLSREERQEYYIEFNLSNLLRGDLASRMAAYQVALLNGIMTINEVRRLENMNSIGPAGDVHYVPLNMTTAERMMLGVDAKTAPQDSTVIQKTFHDLARSALKDGFSRMFTKEANAVRREMSNPEFETWLGDFHASNRGTFQCSLSHASQALSAVGVRKTAVELTERALTGSREELLAAYNSQPRGAFTEMLDGWAERRASQEAERVFSNGHA